MNAEHQNIYILQEIGVEISTESSAVVGISARYVRAFVA